MSRHVIVVGSGASGVHFALTLLRKGHRVTMVDVGRAGASPVMPDASLNDLKKRLDDPAEYFLGRGFDAVLWPGSGKEYYGIPPGKDYVFEEPPGFAYRSDGFAPLFSFARGGLAEAWTGGCYPLTAEEMADFPFSHRDLAVHYDEVACRIGVTGAPDDLTRFLPVHEHLQPPLRLDRHSARLLESYARVRERLNARGVYVGRTRVATLSQPLGSRQPCNYTGRCLWGCPRNSLYTPSQTLAECRTFPTFTYVPDVEVHYLRLGPGGRVGGVVATDITNEQECEFAADTVALAAGALVSTRIFLASMRREGGRNLRLDGLMDNRQLLVPFVNLGMLGKSFNPDSYQYHLLGMGLETDAPRDYVHGQITTLKTALVHPLIQRLPLSLLASTAIVRTLHAALGMVNINLRDTRRPESYVALSDPASHALQLHYAPDAGEPGRIASALARVKSALQSLGCVVPPGMVHVRPMGASVHYAGTVPMTRAATPLTTTPECESRDIGNLFLVDGATFPFLPAKNLTFTLMANAVRVAETAF